MPKRILVVDDEFYIGYLIKMILGRRGYDVSLALNADEALLAISQQQFHLFLVDIAMPGMNGLELCRRLRSLAHTAATPVVMLTARGDERAKVEARESGAEQFVTKPFSPKALQRYVEDMIGAPELDELLTKES